MNKVNLTKITPSTKLTDAMVEFIEIQGYLREEIDLLCHLTKHPEKVSSDTQFVRGFAYRALIKQFGSFIDSFNFMLRNMVLAMSEKELTTRFNKHEITVLRNEKIIVKDNGNVVVRESFLSSATDLEFSFKCFLKAYCDGAELEKGEGWESFQKFLKIRNRLTHPKGFDGLSVSGAEFAIFQSTEKWFLKQLMAAVEAAVENQPFLNVSLSSRDHSREGALKN